MSGNLSASSSIEQDNGIVDEKENVRHILQYECSAYNHHIITGLSQLRDDILLCDLVLVAKGTRINAHRLILAAFSNYFRDMLNNEVDESGLQEIEIVDMDASTLDALVTFCYTGRIKISESNVRCLLPAACLLQMNEVKEVCGEFMMRFLNPSNCLGIRAFADTYACQVLLRCADKYISHNFQDVVHSEEFQQLSVDRLVEVISCEKLNVRSENQVFTAVLEWVKFDLAARKQFLPRILEHVRLSFCHPTFLADTISKDELVMTDVACRDFVDEARNYLLLQLFTLERPNLEAPRIRPRIPYKCKKLLYVAGGAVSGRATASVELLDLRVTNPRWVRVPPMSSRRSSFGLAAEGRWLLAIGGWDGRNHVKNNERFDSTINKWTSDVAPLSTARIAFGLADHYSIYAVGGHNTINCLETVERYNDQRNEWTYVAPMGARRSGLSVSTLDHCIYAVGGSDEGGTVLNTVERLDPREGKWEFVSSMSTPRKYLGTAKTRDYLYAVGGQDGSNCPLNSAERYDPRINKWTAVASMENMRSGVALAAVDEELFAVGGFDGIAYLETVEIFDAKENQWRHHSRMNDRRHEAGVSAVWMRR